MQIPEEIKQDFSREPLERRNLHADPLVQFETWFGEACDEGIPAPNAMTLATVCSDASPTARTVLLKIYDRNGFVFFSNYGSRKASQIKDNPEVALLFPWFSMGRQVSITGSASRISSAASLKYFLSRSRGSQLGAWTSEQSSVISSRDVLETTLAQMKRKFTEGEIPLPSFWGGYQVQPRTIEFWQSRPDRLHDRFQYTRQSDNSWTIDRLAP
ncbi:MAG: pyridoxamine 5'-phosphate oxidase [Pseudomonadota bacterium]|nr:pyridoxamine 5'-phosphate oxidase [Pseudomonadota bacterium]MED5408092.1 pyridoxamine 5'-phosphate oxidase [Pseudomonadota bacterium]